MKRSQRSRHASGRLLVAAIATFFLAACGSGGASFGGGISGTGKPGIKFGDLATGSGITVAGTTFQAALAVVTIGGLPATPGDLADGHVALVEGVIDGALGVAERITVEEAVQGALQAKPGAQHLTVQGQTVQVDEHTIYDDGIVPASPDGLMLGDLLKVYGFVRDRGVVLATRIERTGALSELRLVGIAEHVEAGDDTFDLGGQPVDYGAADVSDLPGGDPAEGQHVLVRGMPVLAPGGVLVATRVSPVGLEDREDNDETEIEGFITAVLSATDVRVGHVTVRVGPGTVYLRGTAADLVLGARIEAEGALVAGRLDARQIEFDAPVELESDVDTVVGSTITLVGLPGLEVQVDTLTEFDGDASALVDVLPGDHLRIRARVTGPATVVAVRLKETSASPDVILQGPVDPSPPPADPFLSILGVPINTSGISESGFESPTDEVIGRAAFFGLVGPSTIVKLQGELMGGVPVWDEAEIEGEAD